MHVVANKCPTIVGLPLYIEASQCIVQDPNKYPILQCKALAEPPVEIVDLLSV